jgi:hypothetical protein
MYHPSQLPLYGYTKKTRNYYIPPSENDYLSEILYSQESLKSLVLIIGMLWDRSRIQAGHSAEAFIKNITCLSDNQKAG